MQLKNCWISGAIIRYGMTNVGDEVSELRVKPAKRNFHNVTKRGPPDYLLLDVSGRREAKSEWVIIV